MASNRAAGGRLDVVSPRRHALRGPGAGRVLRERRLPYLLFDEQSGLAGHGGGTHGRFAIRYGLCLAEFLSSPSVPGARYTCPAVDDPWPIVREWLSARSKPWPRPATATTLPADVGALAGMWYGLLDETTLTTPLVQARADP